MNRLTAVRGIVTALGALGLVCASAGAVGATEPERGESVDAQATALSVTDASADLEKLTLPPVPVELAEYTEALQNELAEDPRFNVVEISEDRKVVTVWWHGDRSDTLTQLLDSSPTELVATTIEQTVYLPADLQATASQIMVNGAGLGVTSVSIPRDGSSLTVSVDASDPAAVRSATAPLDDLSEFPVTVEQSDGIMPGNTRQNDTSSHLGGAFIHSTSTGAGCTSGFSVRKGNAQGSLFAAHCTAVGESWVTYDGFADTTWYDYGTTETRVPAFDGAIMVSSFSQPFIWTGGPTSTTNGAISGVYTAPLGAELCFSGSQSGVVCGNIVQERNFPYSFGGDLNNILGVVTVQASGIPAVGNGDSGGPGFAILSTPDGGAARYASTVISGIPGDSGTNCSGNPGSVGRRCSPTVISTDVASIATSSGWTVQTVP